MTSLEGATDPMKDCDDKRDCAGGKLKSGEPRKKEETVAANGTVTNNKAGAEHPRKSAMKSQYESMLEEFECPISNNLPIEPVIAPDGKVYEKKAIVEYIRRQGKDAVSPCTQQKISKKGLHPALCVLNNIEIGIAAGVYKGELAETWKERMSMKRKVRDAQKKASEGHVPSMEVLGEWYRKGDNELPKNEAKANEWKNKAALKRLQLLIHAGSGKAMHALGHAHANGLHGLEKDEAQAYQWYEKSSNAGDTTGKAFLAHCRINGRGTTQSLANGLLLLMSAANSGSDCACYFLGEIYYKGLHDTTKSSEDAKVLFERALYSGGSCRKSGYFDEENMANARRWLSELNGDDEMTPHLTGKRKHQKSSSPIPFCDCGGQCCSRNDGGVANANIRSTKRLQAVSQAEDAKQSNSQTNMPKSPQESPPTPAYRPRSPPHYPEELEGETTRLQHRGWVIAAATPTLSQRHRADGRAGLSQTKNPGYSSISRARNRGESKSAIKDISPKLSQTGIKRKCYTQANTFESTKPSSKIEIDSEGSSSTIRAKRGKKELVEEGDGGDNDVKWVQCEKCEKWRRLPPQISAEDLPEVWHCNMNTWNPASASCDVEEDRESAFEDDGDGADAGGNNDDNNDDFEDSDILTEEDCGNISSYSDDILSESDDDAD